MLLRSKSRMPTEQEALPGRAQPMTVPERHLVTRKPLTPAPGASLAMFGMGCFWGAERKFWELPGVQATAAGYAGGFTPNPTYEEVCSGLTGHTEVVQVVFDPVRVDYGQLLRVFWENHDPTQGMRQGHDAGTQYRSAIYTYGDDQPRLADASRERYAEVLKRAGLPPITTEIRPAGPFYYAEPYHQQYLASNPNGYCGIGGTGVAFPADL